MPDQQSNSQGMCKSPESFFALPRLLSVTLWSPVHPHDALFHSTNEPISRLTRASGIDQGLHISRTQNRCPQQEWCIPGNRGVILLVVAPFVTALSTFTDAPERFSSTHDLLCKEPISMRRGATLQRRRIAVLWIGRGRASGCVWPQHRD